MGTNEPRSPRRNRAAKGESRAVLTDTVVVRVRPEVSAALSRLAHKQRRRPFELARLLLQDALVREHVLDAAIAQQVG